jgi:hypothetical protein
MARSNKLHTDQRDIKLQITVLSGIVQAKDKKIPELVYLRVRSTHE